MAKGRTEPYDMTPIWKVFNDAFNGMTVPLAKPSIVILDLTQRELSALRAIYNDWVNGRSNTDFKNAGFGDSELAGTIEDIGLKLTGEGGD